MSPTSKTTKDTEEEEAAPEHTLSDFGTGEGAQVSTRGADDPVITPFVGILTDWRAWTAQNGGSQPSQTSPFMFPGVNPITDLVDPRAAYPPYRAVQNLTSGLAMPQVNQWTYAPPANGIKPADPYAGWTAQLERQLNTMVPAQPGVNAQISSITPNTGPPGGGTAVQIFGSGFAASAANGGQATGVNFVNTAGVSTAGTSFSFVNDGQVNVTTPVTGMTTKTDVSITVLIPQIAGQPAGSSNVSLYNCFDVT